MIGAQPPPAAALARQATSGEGGIDTFRRWETHPRRVPIDVGADEHLEIGGWSLATNPWCLFDRLFMVVDGAVAEPFEYALRRDDVVRARRDESLAMCGFQQSFAVAGLGPGSHRMTFLGLAGSRAQSFGEEKTFHVLAKPAPTSSYAPSFEVPGRIRKARGTLAGPRYDGRSAAAIEPGVSLLIEGWYAGSPELGAADEVAVVLVGNMRSYRAAARGCSEPEAGMALGPAGAACGFQTCIDTAQIIPGAYRLVTELTTAGSRRSVASDVWVEIMGDTTSWLPGLLPIYRRRPTYTLDIPLPSQIRQHDTLRLAGSLEVSEMVSAMYVRFNSETTYTLTHTRAPGLTSARQTDRFAALLAIELPVGTHQLEILATDEAYAGIWLVRQHTFEVVRDTITAEPGDV